MTYLLTCEEHSVLPFVNTKDREPTFKRGVTDSMPFPLVLEDEVLLMAITMFRAMRMGAAWLRLFKPSLLRKEQGRVAELVRRKLDPILKVQAGGSRRKLLLGLEKYHREVLD
ncbi:hypothetical protein POM88_036242 [Heracleum sosnowskyi]|uniref:Uncharacterized protein n=1 Tax=Heracleum sosnowskyi TaxID=360622 RepID=A0AAD8HQ47_9APIA|nr:hypothetical protein POM88_036242 [Heracleum sosnowskyi]